MSIFGTGSIVCLRSIDLYIKENTYTYVTLSLLKQSIGTLPRIQRRQLLPLLLQFLYHPRCPPANAFFHMVQELERTELFGGVPKTVSIC